MPKYALENADIVRASDCGRGVMRTCRSLSRTWHPLRLLSDLSLLHSQLVTGLSHSQTRGLETGSQKNAHLADDEQAGSNNCCKEDNSTTYDPTASGTERHQKHAFQKPSRNWAARPLIFQHTS